MNINYISLKDGTPASGYWDQTFIADLLDSLPVDSEREVFVIPGAYQFDVVDDINVTINKYAKVLVFITSDEEGNFPIDKLKHPDMYVYCQYGVSDNVENMPLGYTPETRVRLGSLGYLEKTVPYFFSGQINHVRRRQMGEVLYKYDDTHQYFYPTEGFAQGMSPSEYFICMARANSVPCPPGNLTQDSFRVYEALEAGAVPLVDRFSAQGNGDYWDKLFPDTPLPIYASAQELVSKIELAQDPALRNKVFAWWIAKKMKIRQDLKEKLNINEAMTIIVPTSPIDSHPSTEIIDQTIASIRHHTSMDIIITIDGIREEQEEMRPQYEEYIRRLLWKCNYEYKNVMPILFEKHVHQSGMMKEALKHVRTPLIMYVEHDTPLVTDEEIEWGLISETILSGKAHVIRLHYEARIPEEHEYLMLDSIGKFRATKQWSQRPHIARTDFYRDIMKFFSEESNCFIEDLIYGRCVEADWNDWKLFIYIPDEKNIKRSLNLDGRAGGQKFDDRQIW